MIESINSFIVSNVSEMNYMFLGATFFNQSLDNFNLDRFKTNKLFRIK